MNFWKSLIRIFDILNFIYFEILQKNCSDLIVVSLLNFCGKTEFDESDFDKLVR